MCHQTKLGLFPVLPRQANGGEFAKKFIVRPCTRGVQVEPGLGTFNFTGIKIDASVAVLHAIVSGKCVLFLIGGAHVAGQSTDR
jgi:hypothetical protein